MTSNRTIALKSRVALVLVLAFAAFLLRNTGVNATINVSASLGVVAVLLSADIAFRKGSNRYRIVGVPLLAACALGYYLFLFVGFGRLSLGALACGVALIGSIHMRNYLPKLVLLVATGPAVVYLALQRIAFLEDFRSSTVNASEGIGSVVGPYISLCRILQAMLDNRIEASLGSTLWATATFWIPREWWSAKPNGFGVEMIPITHPGLAGVTGYSDAATILGELIWNLGLLSIMGVLALAVWLRFLDRAIEREIAVRDECSYSFETAKIVLFAVVTSGVLNLAWGGTFTYVTRLFVVVAGLLLYIGLGSLVQSPSSSEERRHSRFITPQNGGQLTVRPEELPVAATAKSVGS